MAKNIGIGVQVDFKDAKEGFHELERSMKVAHRGANEFGKILGGLGAEMGGVGKALGGLAAGFAQGGVWGLAIAGVLALVDHFKEAAKAVEELKKKQEEFFTKLWDNAAKSKEKLNFWGQPPSAPMAAAVNSLNARIAKTQQLIDEEEKYRRKLGESLGKPGTSTADVAEKATLSINRQKQLQTSLEEMKRAVVPMMADLDAQLGVESLDAQKKTDDKKTADAEAHAKARAALDLQLQKDMLDEESKVWFEYYVQISEFPELRVEAEAAASAKILAIRQREEEKAAKIRLDGIQQTALAQVKGDEASGYFETAPGANLSKKPDQVISETSAVMAKKRMDDLKDELKSFQSVGERIGNTFSSIFDIISNGTATAGQKIAAVTSLMVQQLAQVATMVISQMSIDAAAAAIKAGKSAAETPYIGWMIAIPAAAAVLSGLLAMAASRAGGGPTSSGSPYWVGEMGPELFVPSSAGSIVPNNGLAMAGGMNVTINASIVDDSWWRANRMNILNQITQASRNRQI